MLTNRTRMAGIVNENQELLMLDLRMAGIVNEDQDLFVLDLNMNNDMHILFPLIKSIAVLDT